MHSMKRFHFRLDVLLDIKKRAEEEIKKELAKKNGEILASRREREILSRRLETFYIEEKKQRLRVLDLLALRFSISYRSQLQKEITNKDRCIDGFMSELEQVRVRLAQATKERRILEILKEKRLARWKKEYKKEEQENIDDVSQKGYVRRLHAAAAASVDRQTG
jgi:flagellar protein FliJ